MMTLHFRRRVRILPGVALNLGMASVGISAGPRGVHCGWNSRKGTYASAGLVGSGLYAMAYSKTGEGHKVRSVAGSTFSFFVVAILAAAVLSLIVRL